jgi:hypothetical protein
MQPHEWRQLVARIAANYPGQALPAETAAEWYGPLQTFPASEVWDAIDRHRRDLSVNGDGRPRGAWLPNLAEILAAVDANWRERSAERRQLLAHAARAERNGRGGVAAPAETRQARELLEQSKRLPGSPDYLEPRTARERIDALAEQLANRMEREHGETQHAV